MTDTQDKPNPPTTAHRLDDLITAIRSALAQDAAADARSAGASACRAILDVLDPSSRTTTPPAPASPPAPTSPMSPIAAALGAVTSIPREQILEFVVGGLRSMLTQRAPTYLSRPAPSPTAERAIKADHSATPARSTSRTIRKESAGR